MGLRIIICEGDEPPYDTFLELTCDNSHGFFSPTPVLFKHPKGFSRQYADAMKAGWLDHVVNGEREVLCPSCSGKKP